MNLNDFVPGLKASVFRQGNCPNLFLPGLSLLLHSSLFLDLGYSFILSTLHLCRFPFFHHPFPQYCVRCRLHVRVRGLPTSYPWSIDIRDFCAKPLNYLSKVILITFYLLNLLACFYLLIFYCNFPPFLVLTLVCQIPCHC